MSLGRIGRGKIVRLFQETLRVRREREAVILTRRTQSQPTKWHFVSRLPFHLSPVEIWTSEPLVKLKISCYYHSNKLTSLDTL